MMHAALLACTCISSLFVSGDKRFWIDIHDAYRGKTDRKIRQLALIRAL